jgi:hypothetical protein
MTLFHSPSVQSPKAYDLQNLQPNQLVVRVNGAVTKILGSIVDADTMMTALNGGAVLLGNARMSYAQTAAEAAVTVVPTNLFVPSHLITGEVYPQRYGAKFDSVTDDTAALQRTFNVALQCGCQVVLPSGTALVTIPVQTTANISAITQAASAVITVNTVAGANPFSVGQNVSISGVTGMTQINSGYAPASVVAQTTVSAIGGASGAWTVTVPINSTAFTAYVNAGVLTAVIPALAFGTNNPSAASNHPPGMRGQGISTTLKAKAGSAAGNVLQMMGGAATFLRDFVVDGAGLATVCVDTSWPTTLGTTTNNVYENIWVQNFTKNGWLALNDNQAKWTSITSRGAASFALSGFRIEGPGGSFSLDNIQVADSFLSITCQNCDIRGGFTRGVRINESTSGVNFLYLSSVQIYANPTTLSHFTDANPTVHYATTVVFDGCYLLASSGSAQTTTIDCGVAGKWMFNQCAFIFGGSTGIWNLYSANAHAAISPVFVHFDGCTMTDGVHSVFVNSVLGFINRVQDVGAGPGIITSDVPMRVVYRASIPFAGGLGANTFTNIIPPLQMIDDNATFILCVSVNATGADNLACAAFVHAVARSAAGVGPTGAIAQSTTANIANNLVNAISLRYAAAVLVNGTNQAGIDAAINIALPNGSSINVTLIRIANPGVNY